MVSHSPATHLSRPHSLSGTTATSTHLCALRFWRRTTRDRGVQARRPDAERHQQVTARPGPSTTMLANLTCAFRLAAYRRRWTHDGDMRPRVRHMHSWEDAAWLVSATSRLLGERDSSSPYDDPRSGINESGWSAVQP